MGLFKTQTFTTRADKISEFTVATAEYGACVPVIYGTTRVSGNVIYYDDFTAHEHRETQRSGKGGKSKHVSITYTYSVAVMIGLCEGPITGIKRVWVGKELYQYPATEIQLTLTNGKSNQAPWAYLVGKHPEKALPYNGLAYMAGVIDLGTSGSLPNYNFEIQGKLLGSGDGIDVNPADIVRNILDTVGLATVEIEGLDNYRAYCAAADLLVSSPLDATSEAKPAREIINDLMTLTGAYMFWSNDRFKIRVKEDRTLGDWVPDRQVVYDLSNDDFLANNIRALTVQRKDSSEIYNRFPVEFTSRENAYEKETVAFELSDDIVENGVRQAPTMRARWIYTKQRAVKIAERLAREAQHGRNRYSFRLDWAFCRLEPGDLLTLTEATLGLDHTPVIVEGVTEDANGLVTITAISRAKGDYPAATYDVHATERAYVDYNIQAPRTLPVLFQPPVDLTMDGLELWIAAKSEQPGWGGCTVYVSDDNTTYRRAGQISSSARTGKLVNALQPGDLTATVTCNGQLLSGTAQDAERGNTLCWIEGECLSYATVVLTPEGNYRLAGLVRGQYNTTPVKHEAGDDFVRCDAAVLQLPFRKEDIGKKIYLKFCSYNIFGAGEEDLADVQAYEYVLKPYYIPPVNNLTLSNRYRELADDVVRYDIEVDWDPPEFASYQQAQVWYKTSGTQAKDVSTISAGVSASELGYIGKWQYGGQGYSSVTLPQAIIGDTYRVAVCTQDIYGSVESPDVSPQAEILVALKTETPNTPANLSVRLTEVVQIDWDPVRNADVKYYEVRTDSGIGIDSAGLVLRTTEHSCRAGTLNNRQGKIYVYAVSAYGKPSAPATVTYNFPIPESPVVQVTNKIQGLECRTGSLPPGCVGVHWFFDGAGSSNDRDVRAGVLYYHSCPADIYDVSAAYYDCFGDGDRSPAEMVEVEATIPPELIRQESISLEALTNDAKVAIENGGKETVNTAVKGLLGEGAALVLRPDGKLALAASNGEVLTGLFVDDLGNIRLQGKYIHITGDTKIDGNVIVNNMLAGGITADKLKVNSLSAVCATIGVLRTSSTGARTEIQDNLIQVYDANNVLRVRIGVW